MARGACSRHSRLSFAWGTSCERCALEREARSAQAYAEADLYGRLAAALVAHQQRLGEVADLYGVSVPYLERVRALAAHRRRCEREAARDLRPIPEHA